MGLLKTLGELFGNKRATDIEEEEFAVSEHHLNRAIEREKALDALNACFKLETYNSPTTLSSKIEEIAQKNLQALLRNKNEVPETIATYFTRHIQEFNELFNDGKENPNKRKILEEILGTIISINKEIIRRKEEEIQKVAAA